MPTRFRRPFVLLLASFLLASMTVVGTPSHAAAGTAETMESAVLGWINNDRVARGLRPLRVDSRLADLAGDRAATMASKGILSHSIAGDLGAQLTARKIQWWAYGEAIGSSSATWGLTSASRLYAAWKASAPHWAILMSSRYNYIGIGFAYRSANGSTYGSIVETESVDHTAPARRMTGVSRSGTTVKWTWTGYDIWLQTHTTGLKSFDVQYRSSATSTWTTIAWGTTARSKTLYNRAHGRYHYLRVRARDYRGNLSSWSSALRIWVP